MLIENKIVVKGNVRVVWNTIFDIKILAACLPGITKLDQLSYSEYYVEMTQNLGPYKLEMSGKQELTFAEPPIHLEMSGGAETKRGLGRVKDSVVMDLVQVGENVEISYKMDFRLTGKLAGLGDRMFRWKAASIEQEFSKNLSSVLEEMESGE